MRYIAFHDPDSFANKALLLTRAFDELAETLTSFDAILSHYYEAHQRHIDLLFDPPASESEPDASSV